jgi:hypothetical protein
MPSIARDAARELTAIPWAAARGGARRATSVSERLIARVERLRRSRDEVWSAESRYT